MDKKNFEVTDEQAFELGKYLKERREELKYSTNHIEIHTGINKADLSRIENGKKKKINPIYLKELAKVLKLNQIELFNKIGYIDDKYLPKNEIVETEFMTIPVYSSVSAGLGCEVCSDPIDYLPYPKTTGEIIAIRVEGDSMEDTIPDGSTIVVKKNVMVEIGEIGVFLTNGIDYKEGYVKRLRHKNGTYVLESDNKKYEDIKIKTSDIIACGKVIKIMTDTNKKIKDPLYNYIDMLSEEQRKIIEPMLKGLVEKK